MAEKTVQDIILETLSKTDDKVTELIKDMAVVKTKLAFYGILFGAIGSGFLQLIMFLVGEFVK